MSTHTTINENADEQVKAFTQDIVDYIEQEYDDVLEVGYDFCLNVEETEHASYSTIKTKFGMVNVFPDFKGGSAVGTAVNLGVIQAMQKEGFEEEFIETEGKIYGKVMDYNEESVELLGIYLTRKIDFTKN